MVLTEAVPQTTIRQEPGVDLPGIPAGPGGDHRSRIAEADLTPTGLLALKPDLTRRKIQSRRRAGAVLSS
jgi:hypothetical protein